MKLALVALLAWPSIASAADRIPFSAEGDFSEEAVRRGVTATRAQCDAVPNGLWAETKDHGAECLKYWTGGFAGKTVARAVVYFHGDIWVGAGKTSRNYLEMTNAKLQRDAEAWAKRIGAPYVFVGRPGTHGSSGDHMQRRRIAESMQVSAALDRLKERLGIRELVVAGQSGGGHVTASLLTLRGDIVCAVPTSAPSSPSIRWTLRGLKRDTTGYTDSYEPAEHLRRNLVHPALRVFVLGNPQDSNVLWPSQVILATKLKEAGIPVEVLEGEGTGPERHGLSNSSRLVAGWCHRDAPTEDMVKKAREGLKG